MRGIVVTTQNEMYVKDFAQPLYQTVGEAVGGWIEIVHPRGLMRAPSNLCFVCDEEGLMKTPPQALEPVRLRSVRYAHSRQPHCRRHRVYA